MISVVIPTIRGREHWLERCLAAYEVNTSEPWKPIVIRDRPTCGQAWNDGAALATSDYVHFSADDLEPLAGWDEAAIRVADRQLLPAPRVLNPDGTVDSCGGNDSRHLGDGADATFTRIPFLTQPILRAVLPIIETHYYTDAWVSERARHCGFATIVAHGYAFIHHRATEGRLDTMDEDLAAYQQVAGDQAAGLV